MPLVIERVQRFVPFLPARPRSARGGDSVAPPDIPSFLGLGQMWQANHLNLIRMVDNRVAERWPFTEPAPDKKFIASYFQVKVHSTCNIESLP